MEDGDTESENASRVIQDFVFWCRKIGSINGYFCRYIIKMLIRLRAVVVRFSPVEVNLRESTEVCQFY